MRNFIKLAILPAVVSLLLSAVPQKESPQQKYIDKYYSIAVSEMYRTGVPASITLAQGLLESRYGLSFLAADGNNHFGIKCHGWTGKKQYADDDAKGECFRAYQTAEESFRDHSDFLRYRDRYKHLFEYDTRDYKSWAYGLKKAGYATDPQYPSKLIKLIEDYDLSKYDKMSLKDLEKTAPVQDRRGINTVLDKRNTNTAQNTKQEQVKEKSAKRHSSSARKKRTRKSATVSESVIPESPLSVEQPEKFVPRGGETYRFTLSRQTYSLNGVPFIYAVEEESLESLSKSYGLFIKELMKFNDMQPGDRIEPGQIVYLQAKKNQAAKGLEKHIADKDGETLREISQRYAVSLKSLCKLNSLDASHVLREGESINLR